MSHFNLSHGSGGGSANRRRFIGPTHGLSSRHAGRGLVGNLENVGGRILVEAEMHNHKARMKRISARINLSLPWAHQQQQQQRAQQQQQQHGGGGSAPRASSRIRSAQLFDSRHEGEPSAPLQRPTSRASYADGLPARPHSAATFGSTASRPPTATATRQRRHPGPNDDAAPPTDFDVSTLDPDQMQTYEDMLRVLCTLRNGEARQLLETLYREAEEKKLLGAYTGIFPDLEADAAA